jgi:hypothetical protein
VLFEITTQTCYIPHFFQEFNKMSENILMNRYFNACTQDREYESEYVEMDDDIQLSNTIRVESGLFYYDVEYDPLSRIYHIVATNNPAIYQPQ